MKSASKVLSSDKSAVYLDRFEYEILSISWLNADSAKTSPRELLNNYKLLIITKGGAKIFTGSNIYFVKEGDCVIFSPGVLYHAETSHSSGCQFAAINFKLSSPVMEKEFSALLGINGISIYRYILSRRIEDEIESRFLKAMNDENGSYYGLLITLKNIVGDIFYKEHPVQTEGLTAKSSDNEENIVLLCHRYIIKNSSDKITVEQLCRILNVSQSYLYKCFSNVLGISTQQFIANTKLDIAAKELLQTDKSVSQIAMDNGYGNGYGFSTVFKKRFGVSPTQYRSMHG